MDLSPLFRLMADKKASDLFFTPGAPIQIKIQGTLMPVNQQILSADQTKQCAYSLMAPERIARFEQDLEMNFGFPIKDVGSFRVNVFRQRGAVAMVIRYIRPTAPSLEELGVPPMLAELATLKRGLILIVGATGSGKSSTLAAMIEHRNRHRSGHILTLEDPIEFVFKHKKSMINQREVGIDTQSFHHGLKNAMREAPDVIMIGEIRDRETLQHAITYAQSGHLCISTLHANNSYHVMNRMINFFPHDARPGLLMDLSVSLRAVVSQRLVRGLDNKLMPAVEIMLNSNHIAEQIKNGEINAIKDGMENSMHYGSQTFEQALYKLYKNNLISLDEALAQSDSPTNLAWLINNSASLEEIELAKVNKETDEPRRFQKTTSYNMQPLPELSAHEDDPLADLPVLGEDVDAH